MARLRRPYSEDTTFSDGSHRTSPGAPGMSDCRPATRSSPRKKAVKSYETHVGPSDNKQTDMKLQPKSPPKPTASGKQRRLAPLQAACLSKPLQAQPLLLPKTEPALKKCNKTLFTRNLPSPAKKAVYTPPLSDLSEPEETVEVEVEESVWCGSDASSDSEDELPSPRKFLQFTGRPKAEASQGAPIANEDGLDLARRLQSINLDTERNEQQPQLKSLTTVDDIYKNSSRPGSSSDKENNVAILRFSPPRLHSPAKTKQVRPVTPPQSPTKSRLQSPTKTNTKVPSPKLRQSLDAFWNAETVNEWNDQYSPRKVLKSPKKLRLPQEGSSSPTSSPRKAPQSPIKRTKAEREAKQAFEDKKHALAEVFLTELDETVAAGTIRTLAASTGGVRFIWSKTLNTTAGRANWRRETTRLRNLDGTTQTTHKHHASIELAEKVINDEHRLVNVIAHEFCHLANFMVSGIKDQPHGAQFKVWGRLCTQAFKGRGVEVTTKHTFEIEYKYVWRCLGEDCGSEFRRHSKSIDPKRHTCGRCRAKLLQIKPTPRATAMGKDGSGGGKEAGGFAAFVKLNFAVTKASLPPSSTQKVVMEALGKAYRAEKASRVAACETSGAESSTGAKGADDGVERLAEGLEVIELDDD